MFKQILGVDGCEGSRDVIALANNPVARGSELTLAHVLAQVLDEAGVDAPIAIAPTDYSHEPVSTREIGVGYNGRPEDQDEDYTDALGCGW